MDLNRNALRRHAVGLTGRGVGIRLQRIFPRPVARMNENGADEDLVSVVIPAYNEGETLTATVQNLLDALRQSETRSEIVIVDDGSTDNTSEVIAKLQMDHSEVKGVYNAPMHGYGYAVRKGLDSSIGEIIAIVMADGSDSPMDLLSYLNLVK